MARVAVASLALLAAGAAGCTTLVAGRKATKDGSVLGVHSNDGEGDAPGNMRKVRAAHHATPSTRSPGVPQVAYTFGYFTEGYASMNEKQVGMSESTCSAVYVAKPKSQGGKALLSIVDLGQIGLERGSTAREAIQVMGALGEQYGFYAGGSVAGAGESLLVTDTKEAFIFHILPDSTGASAIWAAQRVPDDEFAVVANCFIIREVEQKSTDFLLSSNIEAEARLRGWKTGTPIDFSLLFSKGEYSHKYYSGRRMWGAFHLLAAEQHLNSSYDDLITSRPYPVSVKPDRLLEVADFTHTMRSFYEGTPFDRTQGLAAGPWGSPHRWDGAEQSLPGGWWERTIATHRTIIATLTQSRGWLPDEVGGVLYAAPHAAHTSCFVPFAVGMQELPAAYTNATLTFDRSTAWWTHRVLMNVAELKFRYIYADIQKLQAERETAGQALIAKLTAEYQKTKSMAAVTAGYLANAVETHAAFDALIDTMLHNYADGYCNSCGLQTHIMPYPKEWLEQVGFLKPHPPATQHSCVADCDVHSTLPAYKACVRQCL